MVSVRGMFLCMMLLFFGYRFADAFIPWTITTRHRVQTQHIDRAHDVSFCASRKTCRGPPLCMTSSSSTSTKVVYQKIVKPPSSGVPPALFLANLVEYLQDHFELPPKLPMVYDKQWDTSQEYVVSWDSPLSSASVDTRLNVQVVAIYTQEDSNSLPNMAMVVVKKAETSSGNAIPMMQNLFAESEKQILRALDRGLDDVQLGRIQFAENVSKEVPQNIKSVEEVIDAEILTEKTGAESTSSNGSAAPATIGKSVKSSPAVTTPSASSEDYAVVAAKKAMAKRNGKKKQVIPEGGDYAVEAAKRASRHNLARAENEKPPAVTKESVPKRVAENVVDMDGSVMKKARKEPKRFTISTPKQRAARAAKKSAKTKSLTTSDKDSLTGVSGIKKNGARQKDDVALTIVKSDVTEVSVSKKVKSATTKRSLNLSVEDVHDESAASNEPLPFETMVEDINDNRHTVSQAQMERDVMEAAQKAMSEIEDVELTPEELLHDVMKFGEENDQENAAGAGFVSGAFEKAKELLREQQQQREQRIRRLGFKEKMRPGILDPDESSSGSATLSAEDELRRIFEAGERMADGRIEISKSEQSDSDITETDFKAQTEVDSLIAGDKTISGYARSLDDELAELEVRINKSPGEELDGPAKNPMFDIFSGPEVYNPNVDPETAVNWPGAQPGTKDLRLPKELDEAMKHAKFAAEVLTRMEEVLEDDGSKFLLGDRELKAHQVENIRTVVSEAVEIGLIDDPLEYLSERSRMQMVVDEMWGQPEERYRDIASNFRDLLLSDNFVPLIKERLEAMADRDLDARRRDDDSLEEDHAHERKILGHLVEYAQVLLKEARALGAELEASQLEIVRSICQVAMDPSHKTEEDTANALTDAVRDMRPLLDDVFVAYLKYAIAEEEGRLARAGLLDDPEHNEWLFVLKIVQQGVYTEIARGINRYIEHIMYILRMETKVERRMLLSKIIDNMPTMDVRPFVRVVDKIVASLGDSARGEFDGYALGEMANKILQLRRDIKELLPPERIQLMSRDADEWAAKQKQRLLEQRKVTKQRLKAAKDTTDYDDEIRRRGEIERM